MFLPPLLPLPSLLPLPCPSLSPPLSPFPPPSQLVQPTGKRFLLAIDVSGSMDGYTVLGSSSLTARKASAAMAMLTARTESEYHMVGFSDKMVRLKIDARMSLEEVCTTIGKVCINTAFMDA